MLDCLVLTVSQADIDERLVQTQGRIVAGVIVKKLLNLSRGQSTEDSTHSGSIRGSFFDSFEPPAVVFVLGEFKNAFRIIHTQRLDFRLFETENRTISQIIHFFAERTRGTSGNQKYDLLAWE